jgi:signal transduction histidine kinase
MTLADVWSAENGCPPETWLTRWQTIRAPIHALRFRGPTGTTTPFSVTVSLLNTDPQPLFLFQLFAEPAAAPPPPPGSTEIRVRTVEFNQAQRQKLDCALHLTRTVALDFNNALTTVLGHTSYVLGKMEPDHPWRASLTEVERAAEKAAEVAHQLAAFSLDEKEKRTQPSGDLNGLLQRTVKLFQTPERAALAWNLQFENRIFLTTFDEAKLQQALAKIVENAVEAAREEGRISVRTRNLELTEPSQDRTAYLAAGSYVCVEISDDGAGITPEDLPRVFEPFFTTKYGHRGLGLALVYGIITNHGGGVAISSHPGRGTSVRVYLPATPQTAALPALDDGSLTGQQTILFVDDEAMVANLGQMVLSSFGYRVLTANCGEKALEILAQSNSFIDLLITDMVMPRMTGRELIKKVRELSPATRVICSTACVRSAHSDEDWSYLLKPFNSQTLLRRVKQTLATALAA